MKRKTLLCKVLLTMLWVLAMLPVSAAAEETVETDQTEKLLITTETVVADPGLPENDELFEAYVDQTLYGETFSTWRRNRGDSLVGDEKVLYDALVPAIQKIANGERTSTLIGVGMTVSDGGGNQYIADIEATFEGATFTNESLNRVLDALLSDMPYEMYWYDKTIGCQIMTLATSVRIVNMQVYFKVANNYSGIDPYTVDPAITGAAKQTVRSADEIVEQYAGVSDYEKLVGYKNTICELVSYNFEAAQTGSFSYNNDPWQMIYVFDGNPNTNVVCEGYAKAFMYLCDLTNFESDIACYTVSGFMGSEAHMWNIVSIDGGNYHVDVTNSDTGMFGQNGSLFLVGNSGSVVTGYVFNGIRYVYGADDLDMWGTDADSILKLAEKNYTPKEEKPDEPEVHVHEWIGEVTAPTCTKAGYTTYTCELCKDSYVADQTDALGHKMGSWTVTQEAKCEVTGERERKCERCELPEKEEIAALQHQYKAEVTAPTCTKAGYTTYTCELCKDSYVADQTDALGHKMGSWTVTQEAKCEVAGERERKCERCELPEKEEIAALQHQYKAEVTAPTCTKAGYTTYTCELCKDSYVADQTDALGHKMGSWTVTQEAKCEVAGERERKCERCELPEKEEIAALQHQYKAEVTAPTCTKAGYTTYTCELCKDSYVADQIDALGHSYTNIQITAPGEEKAFCECGEYEVSYTTGWILYNGVYYYRLNDENHTLVMEDMIIDNAISEFDVNGVWKGYAKAGWKQLDGDWYYLSSSGRINIGWKLLGSTWYYLDETGVMVTGWQEIDGEDYFFHSGGGMAKGWVQDGNIWYYMNSSGRKIRENTVIDGCLNLFDENGVWLGYAASGWRQDGEDWYYLSSGGKITKGWKLLGSTWYYFDANGIMQTGWLQLGNIWYYLNSSGGMVTGSVVIDGALNEFNGSGVWLGYAKAGWKQVGSKWYYLGSGGKITKGWKLLGSTWYYFDASGIMQTGWLQAGGTWYYLNSSGAMATGWLKSGSAWYYLSSSGAMVTGTKVIDGVSYQFTGSGALVGTR